jgi:hypothetical protein
MNKSEKASKWIIVGGARPNFMKIAPLIRAIHHLTARMVTSSSPFWFIPDSITMRRHSEGEGGHVESLTGRTGMGAEHHKGVTVEAETGIVPSEVAVHEMEGKTSWPAATGVWVVKTVVSFTTREASS